MTVTLLANAKINLYLEVVGKRPNGYHELRTVMQSISLADTLTVTRTEGEDIFLDTGGVLPGDARNLAVRAARHFFAASKAPFGVHAVLKKRIPMAAGLGGGSADAAAMLRALNALDGDRFTASELAEIGAAVGADVPFCVQGGTCLCEGIGEIMTPVKNSLDLPLVVAIDGEGVSTPTAFGLLDTRHQNFQSLAADSGLPHLLTALENGDEIATVSALFNRFEEVIEPQRPAVSSLKQTLLQKGAVAAQMSGSGPSVFALFQEEKQAERAVEFLKNCGVRAYLCRMC